MRTYRASSLGSCTRAQIAIALDHTALATPEKMQAVYERGNDHEDACLAAMEVEEGWDFLIPGEWYHTTVDKGQHYAVLEVAGARLTGHLDGIGARFGETDRVIEIKSPISWAKWLSANYTGDYSDPLMNRYAWQISCYMVATGLEAVVACLDDGAVKTFGIEVPPFTLEEITYRVAAMESFVEQGIVPGNCSQADWPCPVAYLHERPEVVKDPKLDTFMGVYTIHKEIRDAAEAEMKRVREAIDGHLGILDSLSTEYGTATRVSSTRTTYDTQRAIVDGVDLAPYAKTSTSTSIRVTPKVDGPPEGA